MEEKKAAPVSGLNNKLRFINLHGDNDERELMRRATEWLKIGKYKTSEYNRAITFIFNALKIRIEAELQ